MYLSNQRPFAPLTPLIGRIADTSSNLYKELLFHEKIRWQQQICLNCGKSGAKGWQITQPCLLSQNLKKLFAGEKLWLLFFDIFRADFQELLAYHAASKLDLQMMTIHVITLLHQLLKCYSFNWLDHLAQFACSSPLFTDRGLKFCVKLYLGYTYRWCFSLFSP